MANMVSGKQKVLFSIVIPCYNYATTLPRAINSVLSQNGNDFELLVIDDGSTDGTLNVVNDMLIKEGLLFRFIHQKNKGVSITRNLGIDETKGSYLIFLDADDEMIPDTLKVLRKVISEEGAIGMVVGGHKSITESGYEKEHRARVIPDKPIDRLKLYLLDKTLMIASSYVAISREVFDNYRFPAHFKASEDIPMFAFILANYSVRSVAEPLAIMHKHNDSLRHNVDFANEVGLSLVDEVFDPQRIPGVLQKLKGDFLAQRHLSLFRMHFIVGDYHRARANFHKAIRVKPLVIFRKSYLFKYIRSWF